MSIEVLASTPHGAMCNYHEVQKVSINYTNTTDTPVVEVIVFSWKDESTRLLNQAPSWGWSLPTPGTDLTFEIFDVLDIHEALVSKQFSPFYGGLILGQENNLAQAKKRKLIEIKKEFNQRNTSPLTVQALGTFDADFQSQVKITQTVLLAQTLYAQGEAVSINFTQADNTQVLLDLPKAVTLGLSLAHREQQLRARKAQMRLQVEEATSMEELEAVRWDSPPSTI